MKSNSIEALIKSYLPLNSKRKISDLIHQIQINQIPFSKGIDSLICRNIDDEILRFYYDCITPIKAHNNPLGYPRGKKKKKKIHNEIPHNIKKHSKGNTHFAKINSEKRPMSVNPNSADYKSQLLKANLSSKFDDYDYGLSDW